MQLQATCLALALSILATVSHAKTLEDSELRRFLDPIQYTSVDISPSGKYISFIRRDDEKNTLIIMDLVTMTPTASIKYGDKGKTSKLNVCCTQWVTDELLAYGTTRKMGTLEGEGRQGNHYLLKADGSRNDRVWTPLGNYENNSARRGKLYKGFAEIESVLEDDEDSPFKKITSANDMAGTIEFASDGDKKRYKNSALSKEHILRSTYYKLAVNNLNEVNDCYLNTKPGARVWIVQDLISKIIRNGPDLKYSEQEYENTI